MTLYELYQREHTGILLHCKHTPHPPGSILSHQNKEMVVIGISLKELLQCTELAYQRKLINERNGIKDRSCIKDPYDRRKAEITGTVAELACSKYFGCSFDSSTHSRKGGSDMILKDGRKIDIKCCQIGNEKQKYVVVSESKKLGYADLYIFCKISKIKKGVAPVSVELYGMATEYEIIDDTNKIENKKGYWLKKSKLKDIKV